MKVAWSRFFFAPSPPGTPGILRAAFLLFSLWMARHSFEAWGAVDPVLRQPIGAMHFLPVLGVGTLHILWIAWLVSLALGAIGLFTRVALTAAFVLSFYFLGLRQGFGSVSHTDHVAVLAIGILAASRCGDAWSLDARLRNRSPEPSGEYRWPLRALQILIACIYFCAGITKLIQSGPAWVTSDALAIDIAMLNSWQIYFGYARLGGLAMDLVRMGWPIRAMSAATLLLELLFPLALFFREARAVLVTAAIAFNVSAYFLMGPIFLYLTALNCLVWIPWDELIVKVRRRLRRAT